MCLFNVIIRHEIKRITNKMKLKTLNPIGVTDAARRIGFKYQSSYPVWVRFFSAFSKPVQYMHIGRILYAPLGKMEFIRRVNSIHCTFTLTIPNTRY